MITPSFSLTATERVLPRLALDWTTGLAQPGVDVVRAGVATFVGSNGFIQSATANTQRIDYSTGTSGLLVEESRTNFNLYSEDYSNIAWSKFAVNVSTNVATAPDNTLTADKLTPTATTDIHRILQITILSGSTAALSIFAKAAGYSNIAIRESNTTGQFAAFNLSNGTIFSGSTATSPTIKNMGNGWYRCSIVVSGAATQALGVNILDPTYSGGNPNATWLANGTDGVELWGAQTEVGAFLTSYIPTEALAVTRNADVATMTGTNFSDWYNTSEGSIVFDYDIPTSRPFGAIGGIGQNTFNTSVRFNLVQAARATGSSFPNQVLCGTAALGANKMAIAMKVNDYRSFVNGVSNGTDTNATMIPATANQFNIGWDTATDNVFANGWMRKIFYYPQRLTDAELAAFSK